MRTKIVNSKDVSVSFKLTADDKRELNEIIQQLGTNKSEFFRAKCLNMLKTVREIRDVKMILPEDFPDNTELKTAELRPFNS